MNVAFRFYALPLMLVALAGCASTTGGSVVNAGNQLTAEATHAYQYDDNGNHTRKTLLATRRKNGVRHEYGLTATAICSR